MSYVHSLIGSGGIKEAFAVIHVTYPSGSTCTCTKGTKVLTASGTSGKFVFLIPESGTWTVRCTNGTDTAETQVVIDAQYQAKNVELSYRLPGIYQEVEYLQGDGNAYIQTSILPTDDYNASVVASSWNYNAQNFLLGTRNTAGGTAAGFLFQTTTARAVSARKGSNSVSKTLTGAEMSNKATYKIQGMEFIIDDTVVGSFSTGSYSATKPMTIFALNNGGTVDQATSAKIHSLLVSDSNGVIADFIPCYRKSDNVAGMYDSIGKNFYTNAASTGSFVVGGDVS